MTKIVSVYSSVVLGLWLLLAGALMVHAKAPPPGTNASNGTAEVYFLIDNSGSMGWDVPGYPLYSRGWAQGCSSWNSSRYYYNSRMGFVTRALQSIVSDPDLASNAHFGLITWNSSSRNAFSPSSSGGAAIARMSQTCSSSFRPSGGTRPENSLRDAYNFFARQGSSSNTCGGRQRAVILLSDGEWDSWSQRSALSWVDQLARLGVSTFVVGFTNLSPNSTAGRNYLALAGAGGTRPILSTNMTYITNEIKSYIRSIVQANLSFTSPVILPSVSGADRIFQPDFVFNQRGQWRGSLRGYELRSDGFINQTRGELFDAGALLNNVRAGSRRIWTVMPGFGYSSSSGIGNFTSAYATLIHSQTSRDSGFSQWSYTRDMIDFIRGVDVFNDNDLPNSVQNERWKLGDIYNSTPVLVGPPSAAVLNASVGSVRDVGSASEYRSITNYRAFQSGLSCGVRCANRMEVIYAGSNGGLLHAFDTNGRELWAFMPYAFRHQWGINNPQNRWSRRSTSVYGVDGPIVAQDVYVGGRWRTYLAFGMGRGGRAFYVLDVTDPLAPTLVFGVENNLSNGEVITLTGSGAVRRWYAHQAPNDISDYQYLGYTTSTPRIELKNVSGFPRWVLSIPAGYDLSPVTPTGRALFEIDLDTLQLIGSGATFVSDRNNDAIVNSLIADADLINKNLFISPGSRVDYATVLAEREGILSIVDGNRYSYLVDLGASSAVDRQIFFSPTTGYDRRGVMNIFGATGDYFNIQSRDARNANIVFGVDLDSQLLDTRLIGGNGNQVMRGGSVSHYSGMQATNSRPSCNLSQDWRYHLNTYEKASGAVAVTSSSIFVPAYTPAVNCIGTSRLIELDLSCGTLLNSYNLGEGLVTSPVVYRNTVYAGISSRTTPQGGGQYQNAVREGNLIVIQPAQSISGDGELSFEGWVEY